MGLISVPQRNPWWQEALSGKALMFFSSLNEKLLVLLLDVFFTSLIRALYKHIWCFWSLTSNYIKLTIALYKQTHTRFSRSSFKQVHYLAVIANSSITDTSTYWFTQKYAKSRCKIILLAAISFLRVTSCKDVGGEPLVENCDCYNCERPGCLLPHALGPGQQPLLFHRVCLRLCWPLQFAPTLFSTSWCEDFTHDSKAVHPSYLRPQLLYRDPVILKGFDMGKKPTVCTEATAWPS